MNKPSVGLQTFLGIAPRQPEAAILRLVIELGAESVGAEEGSLLLFDSRRRALVFAMTLGNAASERALVGQRVPLNKGITGLAAVTRQVQVGAPSYHDLRQSRRNAGRGKEPSAVLAAPMIVEDRVIGVITAVSFDPDKRFSAHDADLYGRLAAVAALVVEQNRRLKVMESLGERGGKPALKGPELRIVEAVGRLTKLRQDRLPAVAAMLGAIEDLQR